VRNKRRATDARTPETPTVKRSKADTSDPRPSAAGALSEQAERSTRDDPDATFGLHVANELRLITSLKAKQFAKLQISNILFNAQFGLLSVPVKAATPSSSVCE